MKKFNLFYLLTFIAIIFIVSSCSKSEVITSSGTENTENLKENTATWISSSDGQSKWWFFKLSIKIGHLVTDCNNSCIMIMGELGHADCMGYGRVCNRTANAMLVQDGSSFSLVLEDPEAFGYDLNFQFPDRTLFITNPQNNTDLWLNIPEQTLLRDHNGVSFMIQNIWFSEEPELENQ